MSINGKTILYGIIGNPVSHSLSPAMHNGAFRELGENRVYLPFQVENVEDALRGCRGLQIQGASVTIPHKEAVMPFLDRIDPVALKIGAVNTIRLEEEGGTQLLCGYNTDWIGAIRPLEKKIPLDGRKVIILGAGGSARAIGFGLLEKDAEIVLCSRTESRGRKLADDLGCDWVPLENIGSLRGDVLINATSVGMTPESDKCPVPLDIPGKYKVVMDIVYSPLQTTLLQAAQKADCETVNGLEMLLYQGMAQFELWTGLLPPEEVMRKVLLDAVA